MKIGRYEKNGKIFYGELDGERIHPLVGDLGSLGRAKNQSTISTDSVRILAPVLPTKIIAIGPGHKDIIPAGREAPERPYLFFKPSSAVTNPFDPIIYPPEVSNILYELEVAIVIGRKAHRVSESEAENHILGYTCCNDVTAGSLQKDWGTQFSYHWKAYDTFAPLGPVVATDLRIEGLGMTSRINGVVHGDTKVSLIYSPADLVSWISHIMTLNPGDVIATGAAAQADLKPGDRVDIEIEGIGILSNPVVSAKI